LFWQATSAKTLAKNNTEPRYNTLSEPMRTP
jgi:hypothetical protein